MEKVVTVVSYLCLDLMLLLSLYLREAFYKDMFLNAFFAVFGFTSVHYGSFLDFPSLHKCLLMLLIALFELEMYSFMKDSSFFSK